MPRYLTCRRRGRDHGGRHARSHRSRQTLRTRRGARRRDASRPDPGRIVGFLGTQRRRQDDDDALHLRPRPAGPRRGPLEGEARRPRGAAAVRLHARAARPVPADAGRRAALVLRPATRPVRSRRERGGDALAGPDGPGATAPRPSWRSSRTATSSESSWPSPWRTTRSCSCSTSRSPASTRSGSRR